MCYYRNSDANQEVLEVEQFSEDVGNFIVNNKPSADSIFVFCVDPQLYHNTKLNKYRTVSFLKIPPLRIIINEFENYIIKSYIYKIDENLNSCIFFILNQYPCKNYIVLIANETGIDNLVSLIEKENNLFQLS